MNLLVRDRTNARDLQEFSYSRESLFSPILVDCLGDMRRDSRHFLQAKVSDGVQVEDGMLELPMFLSLLELL